MDRQFPKEKNAMREIFCVKDFRRQKKLKKWKWMFLLNFCCSSSLLSVVMWMYFWLAGINFSREVVFHIRLRILGNVLPFLWKNTVNCVIFCHKKCPRQKNWKHQKWLENNKKMNTNCPLILLMWRYFRVAVSNF